ncbi:Hint domain-containing protein [Cognatishimia sp. F0-27]|uniref:Hint domain-containing protein n=1 Tax=Cognatishimia sp. F0-27 TaxID=2816855 RepID=UPI001D0C5B3C
MFSNDPNLAGTTVSTTQGTYVFCFAIGTRIATPDGARPVETLAIGDPVLTAEGREVPVTWVGRQTVHKLFTPAERFEPVRVHAGALGNGLPHSDLVPTTDHTLILDGLAICAGALVNGTTITRVSKADLPERVTYYHVETEGHEIILAEGAPAETFIDYVARRGFENYAEYVELYGEERTIPEKRLPRISAARLVPPAIRERLSGKAAA